MTVEPDAALGLLVLTAELLALAAVGFFVARVVLRQADVLLALAQGLVVRSGSLGPHGQLCLAPAAWTRRRTCGLGDHANRRHLASSAQPAKPATSTEHAVWLCIGGRRDLLGRTCLPPAPGRPRRASPLDDSRPLSRPVIGHRRLPGTRVSTWPTTMGLTCWWHS